MTRVGWPSFTLVLYNVFAYTERPSSKAPPQPFSHYQKQAQFSSTLNADDASATALPPGNVLRTQCLPNAIIIIIILVIITHTHTRTKTHTHTTHYTYIVCWIKLYITIISCTLHPVILSLNIIYSTVIDEFVYRL